MYIYRINFKWILIMNIWIDKFKLIHNVVFKKKLFVINITKELLYENLKFKLNMKN